MINLFITYNLSCHALDRKRAIVKSMLKNQQIRCTHRLSVSERQRRINYVRDKHINHLVSSHDMLNPMNFVALTQGKWVYYNRGKMRVNVAMFTAMAYDVPALKSYPSLYVKFWKQNLNLRTLNVLMKMYRDYFGQDCFATGKLEITRAGMSAMNAFIIYGKTLRELSRTRFMKASIMWSPELLKVVQENHPAWKVVANNFQQILDFIKLLDRNRGVSSLRENDSILIDTKLDELISYLSDNILVQNRMSKALLARLNGRKAKFYPVMRWYMLHEKPAVKRVYHFTPHVRFISCLSLTRFISYIPFVKVIDRSEQSKPSLIKFVNPTLVKDYKGLAVSNPQFFSPTDALCYHFMEHDKLHNPLRFNKMVSKAMLKAPVKFVPKVEDKKPVVKDFGKFVIRFDPGEE